MTVRDRIFISYSHEDEKWRDRFTLMLSPGMGTELNTLWSDQLITPGARWSEEISTAISSSRVALLLVTPSFLNSKFISETELPEILRQQSDGLLVRWVPVTLAWYDSSVLRTYQAAHPTNEPLDELSDVDCRRAILAIGREIKSQLGQFVSLTSSSRSQLCDETKSRLVGRVTVKEELSCGENSVMYLGQKGSAPVIVKAITNGFQDTNLTMHFAEKAQQIALLRDPCFVRIHDLLLDPPMPRCIIMEHITSRPLIEVLDAGQPISPANTAKILRQITRALSEMHLNGMYLGSIRPSDIFVDEENNVRISALSISNELLESERMRGTLVMNYEFMQYLSPEQLDGDHLDAKTDQYALGVLAVQMLRGRHPFAIKKLADLLQLHELHDNPRDFYGEWIEQAPELYHVVRRMMQRDPRKRFASMGEIYDALRPIAGRGAVANAVEEIAKASYMEKIRGRPRFYHDFYEALFTERAYLRERFPSLSRPRQHRMLDIAIEQLLNFRDSAEPTTLSRAAARHVEFELAAEDWDAFQSAFIKCISRIEEDRDIVAAWRASLRPGIEYMKASWGRAHTNLDSSYGA